MPVPSLLLLNCQSAVSRQKRKAIQDLLDVEKPHIVFLTETKTGVKDEDTLKFDGYSGVFAHRQTSIDRCRNKAGGAAIFVKNGLDYGDAKARVAPTEKTEIVSLLLHRSSYHNCRKIRCICVYLTPGQNKKEQEDILKKILASFGKAPNTTILAGDFNNLKDLNTAMDELKMRELVSCNTYCGGPSQPDTIFVSNEIQEYKNLTGDCLDEKIGDHLPVVVRTK